MPAPTWTAVGPEYACPPSKFQPRLYVVGGQALIMGFSFCQKETMSTLTLTIGLN